MRTTTTIAALTLLAAGTAHAQQIKVGFLWHMHQPNYYPGVSVTAADAFYSFSVVDVHNQRFGPYTSWPLDAINAGLGQPHLGAQVSFSGSLINNLNQLQGAGVNGGMWNNWQSAYQTGRNLSTSRGNPRLDLVAFGHHHPLMPLLDTRDIRMQIKLHKHVHSQTWGGAYSEGMFPPETAFSTRIIPALQAEGIDWVLVDNIHFDRACEGYPYTPSSNLYPPNRADVINPDPAQNGGAWVQLNNLWAPSRVSVPFGYQPHHARHVDPDTGAVSTIIAVPAARYEGNEDGRGGYGAFLYDQVMDQYISYNNDPAHPMLVVLHHDGDNFGGGSEAYYHHNFQNMVNWVSNDGDYDVTTIEDYIEQYPPAANDIIHIESGAWAGADNGDPEFKKWLGDPDAGGRSPDRNSWAVLTAAKNRVFTADNITPYTNIASIINNTGSATDRAWHFLLMGEASDYWYWDNSGLPWDSNVTRAANLAVQQADLIIQHNPPSADTEPPTVFIPQREPYNPGGFEWNASPEPSDFEVWTYAYDVSGLQSVTLKWRADLDGANPLTSTQNETYAGGAEVGAWNSVPMIATTEPTPPGVLAANYKAQRYSAMITGQSETLIDYHVEAVDTRGTVRRTDIQHVYVGDTSTGGTGNTGVTITPDPAVAGQTVTVTYDATGGPLATANPVFIHYGYNGWQTVLPDAPMTSVAGTWTIDINLPADVSQLSMVFNDGAGVWDNNNGQDWHFNVTGATGPAFTIDGTLDAAAIPLATNAGLTLYAALDGSTLYVATNAATSNNDHFIYVAGLPGQMVNANWAKSGQIAQWDAFLADEHENDYSNWFDQSGATEHATGTVLEGTIDLVGELGSLPTAIHLAVGAYTSPDGGTLAGQSPAAVISNGNIEAIEYLRIDFCDLTPEGCCAVDLNNDGTVNSLDLLEFLSGWFVFNPAADYDASGAVNVNDLLDYLTDWFPGC